MVWNKKLWASVEEGDILVSCRAIRSGGREEKARSLNAVEFLANAAEVTDVHEAGA